MNTRLTVIVIGVLFLVLGCGKYTTTSEQFISELEKGQNVEEVLHWTPIGTTKYPSNQLEKITCTNSKGELVYLYPDQNTSIKITSKSSKKTFKAYFDTVFYKDGKLYGLRSRIVGGLQEIDVSDIATIEFKAELPKTKKITDSTSS